MDNDTYLKGDELVDLNNQSDKTFTNFGTEFVKTPLQVYHTRVHVTEVGRRQLATSVTRK